MVRAIPLLVLLVGCPAEPALQPLDTTKAPADLSASPWDDFDDADGPSLLMGVAWRPLIEQDGSWDVGPLRYSVIDREGEVRVDFDLPWPAGQVTHLDLDAAEGGRLLATAVRADDSPIGPDGFVWRTLRLDATDGTTTEVVRLTDAGEIELPRTGRVYPLPGAGGTVRVAPDAEHPDRLWFVPATADGRVGDLHRVDAFDTATAPEVLPPSEWLPPGLTADDGGAPEMAWTLQSSANLPGVALGLDGFVDGAPSRQLVTWTPDEGHGAGLDLTDIGDLVLRVEPSWMPGEAGGHALFQRGAATPFCADPTFVVVSQDASHEVNAGGDLDCGWAGPLLDPASPTFAWFGFSLDGGPGHRLRLSHRGEDIYELDRFVDGIVDRPFLLLEAVQLTP